MNSVRDFLTSLKHENAAAVIYDGGVDPTPAIDFDDPAELCALEFDASLDYSDELGFTQRERVHFGDEASEPKLSADTLSQLEQLRASYAADFDADISLESFVNFVICQFVLQRKRYI